MSSARPPGCKRYPLKNRVTRPQVARRVPLLKQSIRGTLLFCLSFVPPPFSPCSFSRRGTSRSVGRSVTEPPAPPCNSTPFHPILPRGSSHGTVTILSQSTWKLIRPRKRTNLSHVVHARGHTERKRIYLCCYTPDNLEITAKKVASPFHASFSAGRKKKVPPPLCGIVPIKDFFLLLFSFLLAIWYVISEFNSKQFCWLYRMRWISVIWS